MKVLLSSIAKNDIRMLMRVFNAEEQNKDKDFLNDLKESINIILSDYEKLDIKNRKLQVYKTENFPVHIHYLFEDNDSLFVTAIFKENN
ncbi:MULTISPECIES: hypothetical protein [Chryseobacterium]|uniref:Type II toxin-antitoxin system RelE/ParE family toxin n=1 Tax=Chryseobacterium balustinum TaxID=246 RepID=A0AAX2IKW8_9FLAO|nr:MULTISPECIES: hypothetical protein [Chryseobacterium]AZB27946.1 hypothetical protein EB354_00950 [Chryseobacterium balustinum]MDY0932500.1 hypothetical protein [Chryseobacterium sp. CFBP8996]SKB54434.1 hypothetical protein SAMN05421800_10378 [Chryseobacterium balustinum]SQA89837.1 Uncharacterised protein [Chryseobacterium balustinum]